MSRLLGSRLVLGVAPLALLTGTAAATGPSPDPEPTPAVRFSAPADGDHVAGGLHFTLQADWFTIEAAGTSRAGAGHFHVLADGGCLGAGESIVRDADHVHLGAGQSEGVVYLGPGEHELCLQVGDGVHLAIDLTDTVTVDVGVTSTDEWCSVVGEIDALFAAADRADVEFGDRQIGYANIGRLLDQAIAGVGQVDESVRDDVESSLQWARGLIDVVVSAADGTAADEAVGEYFQATSPSLPPDGLPGDRWILDTCGVDISD